MSLSNLLALVKYHRRIAKVDMGSLNSRILVVCPVKNEESGLRRAMLSILSQNHKNLILHVIDNSSDDSSFQIAKSIALNDSRVFISKTNSNLSVNRSWEFALGASLESFQFDYLMFFGGDDWLVDESFLTKSINRIQMCPSLKGVVPNFIDQNGHIKVQMRLREYGNHNRYELCKNWGYVHAIYGIYKRECWEEIFTLYRESYNKGVEFDWWLTFNLLKFQIDQIKTIDFFKFSKSLSYDSDYYLAPQDRKSGEDKRFAVPKNSFRYVLYPLRDLMRLIEDTNNHFRGQPNFLNQNSKLQVLKFKIIFFAPRFKRFVSVYYSLFKDKLISVN